MQPPIPDIFYGIPLIPLVIALVALIEMAVPTIDQYAGVLAVGIATVVGMGVLLTLAPASPPFVDFLTALSWGFGAVAVHGTFIKPLKGQPAIPAPQPPPPLPPKT